ncbi:MAG TPA: hypothetical protein VN367_04980 [Chlorobaculum sp.]|nr:hypothetical protein [Chlorobaculum sp.]
MKSSAKKSVKKAEPAAPQTPAVMPLGVVNYLFIALGAAVIALSYAFMYLEKEVDGFFALNIAPFTLVGAYLWILFAIFYRPDGKKKSGNTP